MKLEMKDKNEKNNTFWKYVKVFALTVITMGIYGAYWAMDNTYPEEDIDADETKKDADTIQRAAGAAFLMGHFNRM